MLALDAGSLEIVVFGAIFIILVQYSPKGLSPLLSRWLPPRPAPALPDIKHDEVLRFGRAKEHSDDAVILSVDGLEKRFGGLVAVKDLSFDVRRGTIHALIGPNGAGKSTNSTAPSSHTRRRAT
jgi:branched-chain amino acid transport system permease protein